MIIVIATAFVFPVLLTEQKFMIKMPQEGSQVRHVALSVNVEYAKSALGIMKVIQLVSFTYIGHA